MAGRTSLFAGGAIFILSAFYYLSFSRYGLNLWDEGVIYNGGLRYLSGQSVFKDFLGYPPGRYLLVEASYRLFGFDMMPVRNLYAILTGTMPLLAFLIARRLMPTLPAAVAVILVLSAPAVYYQRFYGFVFLFNAWTLIAFLENRKNWLFPVLGILSAFAFKLEPLLFFAPAYLFIFLRNVSRLKKALFAGFAAVSLIAVFGWGDMGSYITYRIMNEYRLWGTPFPSLFEGYQGRHFDLFGLMENMVFYLPFIAGPATMWFGWKKEKGWRSDAVLGLGYLQLCALALVVTRAGFDNLVRCLPLFFITAPYLSWRLLEMIRKPEIRQATGGALMAVCALFLIDLNYHNGFYVGSIGAIKGNQAQFTSGRAKGIGTTPDEVQITSALVDWIRKETPEGAPLFTAPLNPIFNYLADRPNPTYYDWVLPATLRGEKDEEKLVAQLESQRPAMIVLVDIAIDNKPERALKIYAPKLVAWIADNYDYAGRVAYFDLWKKE